MRLVVVSLVALLSIGTAETASLPSWQSPITAPSSPSASFGAVPCLAQSCEMPVPVDQGPHLDLLFA